MVLPFSSLTLFVFISQLSLLSFPFPSSQSFLRLFFLAFLVSWCFPSVHNSLFSFFYILHFLPFVIISFTSSSVTHSCIPFSFFHWLSLTPASLNIISAGYSVSTPLARLPLGCPRESCREGKLVIWAVIQREWVIPREKVERAALVSVPFCLRWKSQLQRRARKYCAAMFVELHLSPAMRGRGSLGCGGTQLTHFTAHYTTHYTSRGRIRALQIGLQDPGASSGGGIKKTGSGRKGKWERKGSVKRKGNEEQAEREGCNRKGCKGWKNGESEELRESKQWTRLRKKCSRWSKRK